MDNIKDSDLQAIVKKAEDAVRDIENEELRKIAFQKILDTLLLTLGQSASSQTQQMDPARESEANLQKTRQMNLAELFAVKKPQSYTDITLTIAYYLHYANQGDFTVEDVLITYGKLLIPKPQNPTDVINKNIRKRYISKLDKQKDSKQLYHVTTYGIDYVDNSFSGKSRFVSNPKKKKTSVEEEIKSQS